MKAIVCDKCDLILPPDGNYKNLLPFVGMDGTGEEYHLCDKCYERFAEWVKEREDA